MSRLNDGLRSEQTMTTPPVEIGHGKVHKRRMRVEGGSDRRRVEEVSDGEHEYGTGSDCYTPYTP